MNGPKQPTIKRLFANSGNQCAFPGCDAKLIDEDGLVTGEICHIHARSVGGPRYIETLKGDDVHAFDNLILLCPRHHKTVDADTTAYTADALRQIKDLHQSYFTRTERIDDAIRATLLINAMDRVSVEPNTGNIAINSPGSIQGTNVTIKTQTKKVTIQPPLGTIGADLNKEHYVKHLIARYNEFASKDPTRRRKFSHGAISKNIESHFGARWAFLDEMLFDHVVAYLHARIDKTRLARVNAGKGIPSYSSYEKYTAKHAHK